jgi:hypothetical protein
MSKSGGFAGFSNKDFRALLVNGNIGLYARSPLIPRDSVTSVPPMVALIMERDRRFPACAGLGRGRRAQRIWVWDGRIETRTWEIVERGE